MRCVDVSGPVGIKTAQLQTDISGAVSVVCWPQSGIQVLSVGTAEAAGNLARFLKAQEDALSFHIHT